MQSLQEQHCRNIPGKRRVLFTLLAREDLSKCLDYIIPLSLNLVTALRTAVANEYKLDKTVTVNHAILDAFRLSLQFYKRKK
jgi:hypothetical protein